MQPHTPQRLPPAALRWEPLVPHLGRANRALARYAGILEALPNPEVLLSPLTTQEAVLSSRIEGTQATLGDVLKYEAGAAPRQPRRTEDIHEILNYRKALRAAETELDRRPFSLSILKGLHEVLLDSVRGKDMTPGQFRSTQNWIGAEGSTIEDAAFVPPSPIGLVDHLEAWQTYYRSEEADPLVQLAIVHAQFEILHPFNDGNGRLGRILIPLFLFEKKLLSQPMFYLSGWLEQRRAEYVARLRALDREQDAWNAWAEFFLRAIEDEAARNAQKAKDILAMYDELKGRVIELTHSQYAVPLLDQMFRRPVFSSVHLTFGARSPSKPAVANLLRAVKDDGILKVLRPGAGRQPAIYAFARLVNLCEGKSVM